MDFDPAPAITEALAEALEIGDLGYARPVGLGAAFASFAGSRWSWELDPAQVQPAPDVMTAISEALALLTPPGSGVVINPPVYPPFFLRSEQAGRHVVEVPLTGEGALDLERLGTTLARSDVAAYLLCSPHNPLGRVWRREELLAVADLCDRHQVVLLADEIHAPLVLDGAEFVPVLSLDHPVAERAVAFHSASKGWNVPGLKCGLAVAGSAGLAARLASRAEALLPSHLGVIAAEAAFSRGGDHLDAIRTQLAENRELLGPLLARHLPDLKFIRPEASFVVWLDCPSFGDEPAAVFLERGKVALSRGLDFGEPGRGHARLNIGTSVELLEEIVARMGAAAGGESS